MSVCAHTCKYFCRTDCGSACTIHSTQTFKIELAGRKQNVQVYRISLQRQTSKHKFENVSLQIQTSKHKSAKQNPVFKYTFSNDIAFHMCGFKRVARETCTDIDVDTSLDAAICRLCVCVVGILEWSRSAIMCIVRCRPHYKIDCNSLNSEPIFMKLFFINLRN